MRVICFRMDNHQKQFCQQVPEWYRFHKGSRWINGYGNLHPLRWLNLFKHGFGDLILDSLQSEVGAKETDEFSIPGLTKLFMYGNYVHARAEAESKTIRDVVEEELGLYPYSRKKEFLEPYFIQADLSLDDPMHFKPALTDAGICQVYNGDSLYSTFSSSARIQELQYSIDPRAEKLEPHTITGSGKISQIVMWLDSENKDPLEKDEGSLMIALNSWQTYYDVRINQIELRAGKDIVIKVEPVVHSTSLDFKGLSLKDRKCRFVDEQEVFQDIFNVEMCGIM